MNTLKSIEVRLQTPHSLIRYFAWTIVIAFFIAAIVVSGCFVLLDVILNGSW